MNRVNIIRIALSSFCTITSVSALVASTDALAAEKMEKCYGISKAGMNDCNTSKSSCAGSATKDKQGDAFILLPKGTCNKIVGGTLKPIVEKQ